jgi:hypothetical protein
MQSFLRNAAPRIFSETSAPSLARLSAAPLVGVPFGTGQAVARALSFSRGQTPDRFVSSAAGLPAVFFAAMDGVYAENARAFFGWHGVA